MYNNFDPNTGRKRKLFLQIEDVLACPGKCPGCLVATEERTGRKASMSDELYSLVLSKTASFIKSEGTINEIELFLGFGDHLYLEEQYLIDKYKESDNLISPLLTGNDSVFLFTASLYARYDEVMRRIERMKKVENKKLPFHLNAVLDPTNILLRNKLWNEQIKMLKEMTEIGMGNEITINLSNDVCRVFSPHDTYELLQELGHKGLNINWIPSISNFQKTYTDMETTNKWLLELSKLSYEGKITTDYYEALLMKLNFLEGNSFKKTFDHLIDPFLNRYFYIDHSGNIMSPIDAIGEVPPHRALGYQPSANIKDLGFEEAIPLIIRDIRKGMLNATSWAVCESCEHRDICGLSGFHIYNDILKRIKPDFEKDNKNVCPHIGKTLFPFFKSIDNTNYGFH